MILFETGHLGRMREVIPERVIKYRIFIASPPPLSPPPSPLSSKKHWMFSLLFPCWCLASVTNDSAGTTQTQTLLHNASCKFYLPKLDRNSSLQYCHLANRSVALSQFPVSSPYPALVTWMLVARYPSFLWRQVEPWALYEELRGSTLSLESDPHSSEICSNLYNLPWLCGNQPAVINGSQSWHSHSGKQAAWRQLGWCNPF